MLTRCVRSSPQSPVSPEFHRTCRRVERPDARRERGRKRKPGDTV